MTQGLNLQTAFPKKPLFLYADLPDAALTHSLERCSSLQLDCLPPGLACCATSADGQHNAHSLFPPHPTKSSSSCPALPTDKHPPRWQQLRDVQWEEGAPSCAPPETAVEGQKEETQGRVPTYSP